jgi:hypothetical protein
MRSGLERIFLLSKKRLDLYLFREYFNVDGIRPIIIGDDVDGCNGIRMELCAIDAEEYSGVIAAGIGRDDQPR